jgi:hypothetical protein
MVFKAFKTARMRILRNLIEKNGNTLPNNAAIKEHIQSLDRVFDDDKHKSLLDFLYGNLSILDNKTSALLSFNAFILTIFSIFFVFLNENGNMLMFTLLYTGFFICIISTFICLSVVSLYWSTTSDFKNAREHMVNLIKVRDERTVIYMLSWRMSFWSMLSLFLFVVVVSISKISAQFF